MPRKQLFPSSPVTTSNNTSSPMAIQKEGEPASSVLSPMLMKAKVPGMMPMAEASR